ncbi:hypothetical protein [Staphylococcus aureus]
MKAVDELAKDGKSVELIELRTVQPKDVHIIVASV